ncbi:urea carboxylase system permease [Streptacidiphilus sp. MAP12-16]|uniref:amino acid permease n=1 Tax=Streptacidiphilus sp. MAP12-16 TaxID=3156300 RepID=UPI0035180820
MSEPGAVHTLPPSPDDTSPPASGDAIALASFGYRQQLHRRLGRYASFAAGFSFISVLTTVFQFFAFGFSFGGAAFFWTWPLVLLGQLAVAACFAELAARYPISGAVYQWSTRLSTPTFGWFAGWLMVIGQIVVVSAAALALQVVLPSIWSGFQMVGGDPNPTTSSGAENAVLLGLVLLVATTLVNVVDIRVMSLVNSIGVTCELIGIAVMSVLLLTHTDRGPGVVLHTGHLGGGYLGLFLIASFSAAYVLVGFDSAGEMSEETRAPSRTAPRTILGAVVAAGIGGGLVILGGILAAPSLTDGNLAGGGLSYVLTSRFGSTLGRVLLADVAVAVCVATLAIQTAGARMVFSMARDGQLPGSRRLAAVSDRTGTPNAPAVVVGVLAAAAMSLSFFSPSAYLALGTTCIVLVYLAYAMVTGPMLLGRLRRRPIGGREGLDEAGKPLFSLGRWGLPINVLAVVYGVAMAVNLAWPRAAVYDPQGGHWYLQWFTVLFLLAAAVLGVVAHRSRTRASA